MTAFIEIQKSKKGETFINNQVQNVNDCHAWFELNMEYLNKIAKRKTIKSITIYVKEKYNIIYSYNVK
jgi:hypothetical protein